MGLSHSLFDSDQKPIDFVVYQEGVYQKATGQIKDSIKTSQKLKNNVNKVSSGEATSEQNSPLTEGESEGLPTAASDSLITEEASIKYEPTKKERTEDARKNGYTGKAYMQILIDREGVVRDVKMLNHLKYGLSERAMELALQTRFYPAKIKNEPVAVSRQFSVTFRATD